MSCLLTQLGYQIIIMKCHITAPSVAPMSSSRPVVSRTNSSIAVEWNPPESCSGINGYLRGYHCQLFEEGVALPVMEMVTEVTTAAFDGLRPHTAYTVLIHAMASSGWNVNYPLNVTVKTRATSKGEVICADRYVIILNCSSETRETFALTVTLWAYLYRSQTLTKTAFQLLLLQFRQIL